MMKVQKWMAWVLAICMSLGYAGILPAGAAGEQYAGWTEAGDAALYGEDYDWVMNEYDGVDGIAVYTALGLAWAANQINRGNPQYYKTIHLKRDIDLSSVELSDNNWIPIAATSGAIGFDGENHTVTGLFINRPDEDYQGLFGRVLNNQTELANVTIKNASIIGKDNVGALVGSSIIAIKNCTVEDDVTVTGKNKVGGIAGSCNGMVTNCHNRGTVTSSQERNPSARFTAVCAAGICAVGMGSIYNCSNTGEVTAIGSCVGGITAGMRVYNSYNRGDVTGETFVGGIIGDQLWNTVQNCYNTGRITANGTDEDIIYRGSIAAYDTDTSNITHCFYLEGDSLGIGSNKQDTPGVTDAMAEEDMKGAVMMDSLNEWVIENKEKKPYLRYWKADESISPANSGYPVYSDTLYDTWEDIANAAVEGKDYEANADGLVIKSARGMAYFARRVNSGEDYAQKTVKLGKDINMTAASPTEGGWTVIGDTPHPWNGTFDGQGYTLSSIECIREGETDEAGLFGVISEQGSVKNLVLSDIKIISEGTNSLVGAVASVNRGVIDSCTVEETGAVQGGLIAGGIAGSNEGTIRMCTNRAAVESELQEAGGIAGINRENARIENCTSQADSISAEGCAGGVVGSNKGRIEKSSCTRGDSRTVTITAKERAGGIAGVNEEVIDGCINEADVTGQQSAGGVAGTNSGIVRNCFSGNRKGARTGIVTGRQCAGGIAGENTGRLQNSGVGNGAATTIVVGSDDRMTGGIAGYHSGMMQNCYIDALTSGAGVIGSWDNSRGSADSVVENCYYVNGGWDYYAVGCYLTEEGQMPGYNDESKMKGASVGNIRKSTGINELNLWVQAQASEKYSLWIKEAGGVYALPAAAWSQALVVAPPEITKQVQRDESNEKGSFTLKGQPGAIVEIVAKERYDTSELDFTRARIVTLDENGGAVYEAETGHTFYVRYQMGEEAEGKVVLIANSDYFKKLYRVRFLQYGEDTPLAVRYVWEQEKISNRPEHPIKEGYEFVYWTDDPEKKTEYDLKSFIVSRDTDIYAVWERTFQFENQFEIIFHYGAEESADLKEHISYLDESAVFALDDIQCFIDTNQPRLPDGMSLDESTGIIISTGAQEIGSYTQQFSARDKKPFVVSPDDSNPVSISGYARSAQKAQDVTLHIVKGIPGYTVPNEMTAQRGQTIGELALPDGFSWEEDIKTVIDKVGSNVFHATYTPEDTEHYEIISHIPVSITVEGRKTDIPALGEYENKVQITALEQTDGLCLALECLDEQTKNHQITMYLTQWENGVLKGIQTCPVIWDENKGRIMIDTLSQEEVKIYLWDAAQNPLLETMTGDEIRGMFS
jgi:hypothetical protein